MLARRASSEADGSVATGTRLAPVQAAVDENAGEPDFKRPSFAIRSNVREDFDEGVLDRLVGISGVAQILERDSRRPSLVQCDQLTESLTRPLHLASFGEAANFDGQL